LINNIDADGNVGIYGSKVIFNSPKDKINRFNRKNQKSIERELLRDKLEVLIPNENCTA